MTIYIKNMVCVRCKMAVEAVLKSLKIEFHSIELGRVELVNEISLQDYKKLDLSLKYYELELMDNRKEILVERIKVLIIDLFHSPELDMGGKFSEYLSKNLYHEYTYLANVFSDLEGSTIERFFISTRVERVKELLVYDSQLTIKEIAFQLNYSSESHLCQQFKKITGLTPKVFKNTWESDKILWRR